MAFSGEAHVVTACNVAAMVSTSAASINSTGCGPRVLRLQAREHVASTVACGNCCTVRTARPPPTETPFKNKSDESNARRNGIDTLQQPLATRCRLACLARRTGGYRVQQIIHKACDRLHHERRGSHVRDARYEAARRKGSHLRGTTLLAEGLCN